METQNNQAGVLAHLEKLAPSQLVTDPNVTARFVRLYNDIHGGTKGETIYYKEQFNFMKLVSESKDLQVSSKLSLYGCFLDVAVNGLSLDQGSKPQCYLLTRNINTAPKNQPEKWEKRAYMQISPYGELVMRMRCGQIKHADNPIVIYEGDIFEPEIDENGTKKVRYKPSIPRKSKKIIGGFIKITRNDNTTDLQWMLLDDVERLKRYSNKSNKGDATNNKANALYTSNEGQIDPGFFEAKIIKHAFRSYPKVRTGDFTALETLVEEPKAIDYGLDTKDQGADAPSDFSSAEVMDEEAFGATEDSNNSQSVTIETTDDTF